MLDMTVIIILIAVAALFAGLYFDARYRCGAEKKELMNTVAILYKQNNDIIEAAGNQQNELLEARRLVNALLSENDRILRDSEEVKQELKSLKEKYE